VIRARLHHRPLAPWHLIGWQPEELSPEARDWRGTGAHFFRLVFRLPSGEIAKGNVWHGHSSSYGFHDEANRNRAAQAFMDSPHFDLVSEIGERAFERAGS
jgi:hypothetical protein